MLVNLKMGKRLKICKSIIFKRNVENGYGVAQWKLNPNMLMIHLWIIQFFNFNFFDLSMTIPAIRIRPILLAQQAAVEHRYRIPTVLRQRRPLAQIQQLILLPHSIFSTSLLRPVLIHLLSSAGFVQHP